MMVKNDAWNRIDRKADELVNAIRKELENGTLDGILDCAWSKYEELKYDLDIVIVKSRAKTKIQRTVVLELSIELEADN